MAYFIETFDKADSGAVRLAHRQAHLAYLTETKRLLIACGAKRDEGSGAPIGGVYLLDVGTREAAESYIAADPFSRAGLFGDVRIYEWVKGFVAGERLI